MDEKRQAYSIRQIQKTKLGRFVVVQNEVVKKDGRYPYSYLEEKPCVCVLPLIDGKIVVIRQYRYAVSEWCMELPCGAIEIGEEAGQAAERELFEETGCQADSLVPLGKCYARAGISDCIVHFYVAICGGVRAPAPDPTELIQTVQVSLEKFEELIESGQFNQLMGIVCWQRAKHALNIGPSVKND